ncbi:hypothetical protein Z045_16615 [Rhodococcus pyridinivorans KG-16]|uniref:DUF2029 domain-containing protein n=1 Tax=Rhodococcus pyridinivorans KG-16 TaxID=1441730 RepID=A0A0V9UHX1_9NOCA|nr:hypothetical protein [Rhodococcus pyridinivorans]KSZ57593.1 hypothetical protein Z045_16615 [Rhodococcus pyridinivorans KG-16]
MTVFVKTARFIGDLDDEFYRDERQRDVWNEASAVGFQLSLWIALVAAALLPWLAGRLGAWTALGILVAWFVVSIVTQLYARQRDVDLYATAKLWRPRSTAAAGLYLVGVAGIFLQLRYESHPFENDAATWAGRVVGAAVAIVLAGLALAWSRRRTQRRLDAEEALDALED